MFRIKASRHAGQPWLEATITKRLRTSVEYVLDAMDHLGRSGCDDARQAACALRKLQCTLIQRDGTLCWKTTDSVAKEQLRLVSETPEPPYTLKAHHDQDGDTPAA
jgi:hypothetical protein